MDETIVQLMAFLKEASPIVWDAYAKQVYITAYRNAILSAFALIGCIAVAISAIKDDDNDRKTLKFYVLFGTALMLFLSSFTAINNFLNPDYQAIQLIIQSLRGLR